MNEQLQGITSENENYNEMFNKLLDSRLYEVVYGERQEGERIYEYEERRKNVYLAICALAEEDKEELRQYYDEQIAAEREKIRMLTQQGIETENQLAAEREKVEALESGIAESETLLQKSNAERDQAIEQLELEKSKHSITLQQFNHLGTVCEQKNAKIEKLELDLEEARRPKASGTTGSTKELIANIKPASSLAAKARSSYEMFLERNKDVAQELNMLEPPAIEPVNGGDSFRTEVTAPELTSDQFHTPEAPEAVTDEQFRSCDSNNPEATMVGDNTGTEAGVQGSETVSDTVTRAEFEALKKRVESIESNRTMEAA